MTEPTVEELHAQNATLRAALEVATRYVGLMRGGGVEPEAVEAAWKQCTSALTPASPGRVAAAVQVR